MTHNLRVLTEFVSVCHVCHKAGRELQWDLCYSKSLFLSPYARNSHLTLHQMSIFAFKILPKIHASHSGVSLTAKGSLEMHRIVYRERCLQQNICDRVKWVHWNPKPSDGHLVLSCITNLIPTPGLLKGSLSFQQSWASLELCIVVDPNKPLDPNNPELWITLYLIENLTPLVAPQE